VEFNGFDGVRILVSEQADGSMDRASIDKNLANFLKKTNILSPVAYCEQVHGEKINLIIKPGFYINVDGLVTGEDIGLVVKSADCIPLLLFFQKEGMIGALHVGWRSLAKGIISGSLKRIIEENSLSPTEAKIFIGPHIRKQSYEVRENMVSQLPQRLNNFSVSYRNRFYFDLTEAAINELESIGIKRENIVDSGIDTYLEPKLFSYRKGDKGLFITLILKTNG